MHAAQGMSPAGWAAMQLSSLVKPCARQTVDAPLPPALGSTARAAGRGASHLQCFAEAQLLPNYELNLHRPRPLLHSPLHARARAWRRPQLWTRPELKRQHCAHEGGYQEQTNVHGQEKGGDRTIKCTGVLTTGAACCCCRRRLLLATTTGAARRCNVRARAAVCWRPAAWGMGGNALITPSTERRPCRRMPQVAGGRHGSSRCLPATTPASTVPPPSPSFPPRPSPLPRPLCPLRVRRYAACRRSPCGL